MGEGAWDNDWFGIEWGSGEVVSVHLSNQWHAQHTADDIAALMVTFLSSELARRRDGESTIDFDTPQIAPDAMDAITEELLVIADELAAPVSHDQAELTASDEPFGQIVDRGVSVVAGPGSHIEVRIDSQWSERAAVSSLAESVQRALTAAYRGAPAPQRHRIRNQRLARLVHDLYGEE